MKNLEKIEKQIADKIRIKANNIDLAIKVYEENLSLKIVERAKRLAGIYQTDREFSDSVDKSEKNLKEER